MQDIVKIHYELEKMGHHLDSSNRIVHRITVVLRIQYHKKIKLNTGSMLNMIFTWYN